MITKRLTRRGRTAASTVACLSVLMAGVAVLGKGAVQPASAAGFGVDTQVAVNQTKASTKIVSPRLGTSGPNELLVAFLSSGGPQGSESFASVSGGGLSWSLASRANAVYGDAEVWTAWAPNQMSPFRVTAVRSSGSYKGALVVISVAGASPQLGAQADYSGTAAPQVVLSPTTAGSLVWAVGSDWQGTQAVVPGADQTMVVQYQDGGAGTWWLQNLATPTTALSTTLNDSAPSGDTVDFAGVEVLPAPPGSTTTTTSTTAPPPTTTTTAPPPTTTTSTTAPPPPTTTTSTTAPPPTTTTTAPPPPPGVPALDHVFVIVMENQTYGSIIGNTAEAPYTNQLAGQYSYSANYFAVTHPSLPNYLALTGGDTFGITSDCTTCWVSAPNLADSVEAAGRTVRSYEESIPSACFVGDSYPYAQKHDPLIYFNDVRTNTTRCKNDIVPYTQLGTDLASTATTPSFGFITPNLCNDMHDCSIAQGDTWLSQNVPAILGSPAFTQQHSALFIVWDEDDTSGSNQVALVAAGPTVRPGYVSSAFATHYSLLHTIEDGLSLPTLTANDAGAAPMTDLFLP